jgi:hypothetical protein
MTEKKEEVNKDIKYNKTGREPLFRVEIVKGDSPEFAKEMRDMKGDLLEKSEDDSQILKKTITDMYKFAKEKGFFIKKDLQ